MIGNENLLNGLNTLLTRNYDAAKGFKEAANGSKNAAFRTLLLQRSDVRKGFIKNLELEIKALGGQPDKGSSILAGMHRTWIDFKTDWIDDDATAIIDEIQFGEERTIEDYEKVLSEQQMLNSTRSLLKHQIETIKQSLSSMKKFKSTLEMVS
jgi:uncharacterized protein (TIGR02284 family)